MVMRSRQSARQHSKMVMKWQQQKCGLCFCVCVLVCGWALFRIMCAPLCCVCHLMSRLLHRFNVHSATINKEWAQKCNEFQIFWVKMANFGMKQNEEIRTTTATFTNILRISFDSFMAFLTVIRENRAPDHGAYHARNPTTSEHWRSLTEAQRWNIQQS